MLVFETLFRLFRENKGDFVPMSSFALWLNMLDYYIPPISNKVKLLVIVVVWNYSRGKLNNTACSGYIQKWDNLA